MPRAHPRAPGAPSGRPGRRSMSCCPHIGHLRCSFTICVPMALGVFLRDATTESLYVVEPVLPAICALSPRLSRVEVEDRERPDHGPYSRRAIAPRAGARRSIRIPASTGSPPAMRSTAHTIWSLAAASSQCPGQIAPATPTMRYATPVNMPSPRSALSSLRLLHLDPSRSSVWCCIAVA